jgi:putative ABC transport system ATP-binding protein/lipoprotein-releasing system ATP-binding protein
LSSRRSEVPQIEIKGLRKVFHVEGTEVPAVDGVSLEIERGDFLSVVGHSGSGKTTLISIVGGILKPTSGKVLVEGEDVAGFDDDRLSEYRNRRIGIMFQFASLLPILTARENVLLPTLFGSGAGRKEEQRALELLERVSIGDKAGSFPAQLSGGQQRRVAIARALINKPEIILADEPTGDLDEETEADIMNLFRKINEEEKVTMILVTHSLDLAGQASTRLRMSNGKLSDAGVRR